MKQKIKNLVDSLSNKNLSQKEKSAILKVIDYMDSPGIHIAEKTNKITPSYNFDWDDNILFMKTNIWLFHKDENKAKESNLPLEIPVSTETFRHVRKKLGKIQQFFPIVKMQKKSMKTQMA